MNEYILSYFYLAFKVLKSKTEDFMSLKDQTEQKLEENLLLLGYSLVKLNIIYGKKEIK